jgi:nucleoside permease NupC
MILTGLAIFASAALLLAKLKRKLLLRALNHDLIIDVGVTVTVLAIHWGTFSGVMAATFAGLLTSMATSTAKHLVGYIRGGVYHPGLFHLNPKA